MSLINREDLMAEYDRVHVGPAGGARKLMEEAREVKAIPISWIEAYADFLSTIPDPVAGNDERSIRVMLLKRKMCPDIPGYTEKQDDITADGCNADHCEIGGHNEQA